MPPKRARATSSPKGSGNATQASTPAKQSHSKTPARSRTSHVVKRTTGQDGVTSPSLQFFLIVALSLASELITNALLVSYIGGPELGAVSKKLDNLWDIGSLAAWKILGLWIGWSESFDDRAIFHFTLLTHLPLSHLLYTFYDIPALPLALNILSTAMASKVAFALVLPSSASASQRVQLPILSPQTQITSALLAAALYALPLYFSMATWLPTFVITHFDNVRTLVPVHEASFLGTALLCSAVGCGWSAQSFLLKEPAQLARIKTPTSAEVVAEQRRKEERDAFDPEAASLRETISYNLKGLLFWQDLGIQGRETLRRMLLLTAWTTINAAVVGGLSIDGVVSPEGFEPHDLSGLFGKDRSLSDAIRTSNLEHRKSSLWAWTGALGWAACWGIGALLSGISLGWVGDAW